MHTIFLFFLIFSSLICANCFLSRYHPYPYYPPAKRQIFGNVEGAERIGCQYERRWGFPFFTREALIIFPSVCERFVHRIHFLIIYSSNRNTPLTHHMIITITYAELYTKICLMMTIVCQNLKSPRVEYMIEM